MSNIDPIFAAVTATGSPFEIGERDGVPQFVAAPPDLNMLIESAKMHGDKTFIVEGEKRLSFADVFQLGDALAAELNIKRGDHVAICMRNRSEWMVAFMAVIRMGGVAALVNSRGAPEELAAAVHDIDAKLVLADSSRATLIRDGGYQGRILEAEDFPDEATELPDHIAAEPNDACAILFTSGTTGRIKGAVLSHKNLITGLLSIQLSGFMVLHNMAH